MNRIVIAITLSIAFTFFSIQRANASALKIFSIGSIAFVVVTMAGDAQAAYIDSVNRGKGDDTAACEAIKAGAKVGYEDVKGDIVDMYDGTVFLANEYVLDPARKLISDYDNKIGIKGDGSFSDNAWIKAREIEKKANNIISFWSRTTKGYMTTLIDDNSENIETGKVAAKEYVAKICGEDVFAGAR